MLGVLALLLACAQVSSVTNSQIRGTPPRYMGRVQNLVDHGDGTAGSSNWSGYTVLGSSFEWVLGSWIVPKAACTGIAGDHFAAFWVGLDGYKSSTVEQIGTLTDCAGKKPAYYAWYEFYPQGMVPIASLTVEPGDHISAWVVYHGKEEFVVTIKDNTTGKSFTTSATVPGAIRASAEWVAEAPCCTSTGGVQPMTDFGKVDFGQGSTGIDRTNYAMDTSTDAPIGGFPSVNIIRLTKTSTTSSPETSTCSALTTDGTTFDCKWKGLGRTTP
jgi:hypothetical protein